MSKRIRSQQLFLFLESTGALNGTEADIALAKKKYRTLYKKVWAKERQSKKKEIHILFSPKEYEEIQRKAKSMGTNPTKLLRNILLASLKSTEPIPHKEMLLKILQALSISNMGLNKSKYLYPDEAKEILKDLVEVEMQLLSYIESH
jgi:hypothetical protein